MNNSIFVNYKICKVKSLHSTIEDSKLQILNTKPLFAFSDECKPR